MIQWTHHRILVVVVLVAAFVCLPKLVSSSSNTEFHDVKYFFDHIEMFSENLPRTITENIIVKGRLFTFSVQPQCKMAPCPPVLLFGLQDLSDEKYKITMFGPLLDRLKVGRVYVLSGELNKGIDFGRKVVYISGFMPQKIVSGE